MNFPVRNDLSHPKAVRKRHAEIKKGRLKLQHRLLPTRHPFFNINFAQKLLFHKFTVHGSLRHYLLSLTAAFDLIFN
jgi:hypothetical protein